MDYSKYWPLVAEVLKRGPADGLDILDHIAQHESNLWETLYLSTRSSAYAPLWREVYGSQRFFQETTQGSSSLLEMVVGLLIDECNGLQSNSEHRGILFMVKLIANCCADNDHNRRVVIMAGGLLPLIELLRKGADPNILVPTIYNVCSDLEDPAERITAEAAMSSETRVSVTLAEERLAKADETSNSIYTGIVAFLDSQVVSRCSDDVKDYLSDLVEMSARPASAAREGVTPADVRDLSFAIKRLLAWDGGVRLAEQSVQCRFSIVRSLFAVSTSAAAKSFLASTGTIFSLSLVAHFPARDAEYFGEDEEEQQEHIEASRTLQAAMLKLVYEVCRLPQFTDPPKYGIARESLNIVRESTAVLLNKKEYQSKSDVTLAGSADGRASSYGAIDSFPTSIAYIMLYGFLDSDARAHLLASEGLITSLLDTLRYEQDKSVLHPALGVATKLAVTWSLRRHLYAQNAMQAVQPFLTNANLGYEIPLNTVTFLELMMKGHPEHAAALIAGSQTSIMSDIFLLFQKGNDAICFEIGRLVIEICAIMAQQPRSDAGSSSLTLETIIEDFPPEQWARVMIFMASKAQSEETLVAQRVWFALGILSATSYGKKVVTLTLQNSDVRQNADQASRQPGYLSDNIKFIVYNLQQNATVEAGLVSAVGQMSLR